MMKKLFLVLSVILLLNLSLVSANGTHDFNETKKLIDSKVSCDNLTDEQLEEIGDYYMEQMHPGESHELMDNMMGGEGSESLKQMHINMARRLYCNENVNYGMMGSGMMGGSMMNGGTIGSGMMDGSFMGGSWGYLGILALVFWVLVILVLILVIIWLYKKITGRESGSVQDIIKQRYAKGEITKKEFDKMKKELKY